MRIAITGTPGTGKSAVARRLRALGELVIDLNGLAFKHHLLGPYDRKRKTREVDLAGLGRFIDRQYPKKGRIFLESHYSHLLKVDRVVVLRCAPAVLRRRLARRGYPGSKVRENSLAEALDAITSEAVARLGSRSVFEIDTTRRRPAATAALVLRLARAGFRNATRFAPGRLNFSEDILRNAGFYTSKAR